MATTQAIARSQAEMQQRQQETLDELVKGFNELKLQVHGIIIHMGPIKEAIKDRAASVSEIDPGELKAFEADPAISNDISELRQEFGNVKDVLAEIMSRLPASTKASTPAQAQQPQQTAKPAQASAKPASPAKKEDEGK